MKQHIWCANKMVGAGNIPGACDQDRIFVENFENFGPKSNKFVSSRGLLYSCDWYSFSPSSSITKLHDYPPFSNHNLRKHPIIYVCSTAILHFIQLLPQIDTDFVLVSGDSDATIPDDLGTVRGALEQLLSNKYLKHWFCQNMTLTHDKITRLPIGLDYHTLEKHALWGSITSAKKQEEMLISVRNTMRPFWERKIMCYANYHFAMTPDRKDAEQSIAKSIVYYEPTKIERFDTWKKQIQFAFVISPHGEGLDCHRTWEALCLGCIPIVKTSKIDKLYDELPVLIVNEWKDVNAEFLKETVNTFRNKKFNMEKLTLKYWTDKFKL